MSKTAQFGKHFQITTEFHVYFVGHMLFAISRIKSCKNKSYLRQIMPNLHNDIYIFLFIYLLIYLYIFIYIYFIYVPLLQYASSVATPGLVLWEKIMSAWMVRWVGQPATSPNRTSSQSHLQPGNLRSYQLRLPESNFNLHSPKKNINEQKLNLRITLQDLQQLQFPILPTTF